MVHTLSLEGELLPPRHGEHRDDEDGHRRGIPPSDRVPTGGRLVFGGYSGLRRRNSRSRFLFGGFCIYRNFWRRSHIRGGSPSCPRGRGPRPGGGRAPTLVGSPGLSWSNSDTPLASSGPKISFMKFQVNWTPFDFPFMRYSKTRKKQKLALGSMLIG